MTELLPGIEPRGHATFSDCDLYRYTLWRTIRPYAKRKKGKGTCAFVMLNPSTATAEENDPTIRRCIGYATDWGYVQLLVLNAFAFRGTNPKDMMAAEDPVGPKNDHWFRETILTGSLIPPAVTHVIVAWGKHGTHRDRDLAVMDLLYDMKVFPLCLGINKDGTPKHPLYLKKDLQPTRYLGRELHRTTSG